MAQHPPDPFFHQMQRKWKWFAVPIGLLCLGGVVGIALYDADAGIAGAAAGIVFGLAILVAQAVFFPNSISRDPLKQERQYWKWMPLGIVGGGIGAGLIEAFSEWTQLTLMAALCAFLLVMVGFRWWFEASAYAKRKWPAPSSG